jgi:hypothetical protein
MLSTGQPNPVYDGSTVRDAQGWLCKQWAKTRAKLKRLSILIYGFRIAEPHHDGTPHWHMVLFAMEAHRAAVQSVLAGFWLSDGGDDPGARKHRTTVKNIDSHKGTAAGYVAKYVAKNIDGFEVGEDLEQQNSNAAETCERVQTWASRHGIRQFQQIGGPPVTVWRELRRLRTACSVGSIEAARVHADAGEWAEFISALGGIEAGRKGTVGLWTEITGEINQYDEMRGPQIAGVQSGVLQVKTRLSIWRIEKKTATGIPGESGGHRSAATPGLSSLGPVTITVRADSGVGAPSAWANPNETSMYGPN